VNTDYKTVRRALLDQDLRLKDLAQRINTPLTTLGSWLRGDHPGPADLASRLEGALGLDPGALCKRN